jgi:hypothetical protein
MCVHKVRSKENSFYLCRFYVLRYVQIKTQLSHLGILCDSYLNHNFRKGHVLKPAV